MRIVDADAHVIENEHTWDFLEPAYKHLRPQRLAGNDAGSKGKDYWVIDGRLYPVMKGTIDIQSGGGLAEKIQAPDTSRSMEDVSARLKHMDELGTDIQVLYGTLFVAPYTDRPDMEIAYTQAFNRWMADTWKKGAGRLRWAAVLPLRTMDAALEELRFAKANGACAVMTRGLECGDKMASDPYFFPLYDLAERLDVPICIHSGNGSFGLSDMYGGDSGFNRFKLVGVGSFHDLLFKRIPERFPKLRFGFIELSAQWLPYALNDIERRFSRLERPISRQPLADNRIYVACQTTDDLDYVLARVGDGNLVIGTDYGHADTATELFALKTFSKDNRVSEQARRRILDDNARALYAL